MDRSSIWKLPEELDTFIWECLELLDVLHLRAASKQLLTKYNATKTNLWAIVKPGRRLYMAKNDNLCSIQFFMKAFQLKHSDIHDESNTISTPDYISPNTFSSACREGNLQIVQWMANEFGINDEWNKKIVYGFQLACEVGKLDIVRWLKQTFRITRSSVTSLSHWAFKNCCQSGNLQLVQWILEEFQLTDLINDAIVYNTFSYICEKGYHDLVKWYVDHFRLTFDGLMHSGILIARICKAGHFDLFKWFAERFELNSDKVRATKSAFRAFNEICKSGNLPFLQWFVQTFNVDRSEVLADYCLCIKQSCVYGNLETAQWIVSEFKITPDEMSDCIQHIFGTVCKKGYLQTAKWLFSLTTADTSFLYLMNIFDDVCSGGHLSVAQWLFKAFEFSKEDVISNCGVEHATRDALTESCQNKHFRIFEWLITAFDLMELDVCNYSARLFRIICSHNELEIAITFAERFKITRFHIIDDNYGAFIAACCTGNRKLVEYLLTRFELSIIAVRHNKCLALRQLYENNHLVLSTWLIERLQLKFDDVEPHITDILKKLQLDGKRFAVQSIIIDFRIAPDRVRMIIPPAIPEMALAIEE